VREEVLEAAGRRAEALAARDAAALVRLLHPEFVWTTHRGEVMDRDRYVASNTGGALRWVGQVLEEPSVAVVGDTAVVTAIVVDQVERAGVAQVFRLRLTQTWVRDPAGWECLAGHAGTLPD